MTDHLADLRQPDGHIPDWHRAEAERRLARTGHNLSRQQIAKHGMDRYPTAELQLGKVTEELGELWGAVIEEGHGSFHPTKYMDEIRKEYADVGLALYALGDKLGLDLIECMAAVVENDERKIR